ncbi:MAG: hypothetical protein ACYTGW_08295 [Planctomycetota bacterium]|jgi:hypothetical protein
MSYDPRTIAFLAEVLFEPIELASDTVQGIHNTLYRRPEISYQNFQVAQDGIHLTNLPEVPGSVSTATFLPDRLVLREELRGVTVEDFAARLVNVASISFEALQIHASHAQQFVIRSLITPRHVPDSREFLSHRMMAASGPHLHKLGRPIESLGVRYTFPQHDDQKEVFNVRIETWNQDPRSIWLENVGQFSQPMTTENIPALSDHLFSTYRFLIGPVCEFLADFDRV